MSDTRIDWNRNCEFDTNGKVTRFIIPSTKNSYLMRPIPNDEQTLQEARVVENQIKAIRAGSKPEDIATALYKLRQHCVTAKRTKNEEKLLFADYFEDLQEYPISMIEMACKKYRNLSEGNTFMPTVGTLKAMMAKDFKELQRIKAKIDNILYGKSSVKPEHIQTTQMLSGILKDLNLNNKGKE